MGIEQRNGRTYYYRSRRVNGRVRREYAGAGEAAVLFAKWDAIERDRRDSAMWERATLLRRADEILTAGAEFDRFAARVFRAVMLLTGHHQHKRGEWRRVRGVKPMATVRDLGTPPQNPTAEPAPRSQAAFTGGGTPALTAMREFLSDPRQANAVGHLALSTRAALVGLITANNATVATALAQQCNRQVQELLAESDPEPSLAEWMAAARVVNNWLTVHALESQAAGCVQTGNSAGALDRRLTQAERRLHASLKSLAVLRRLRQPVALTQVNVTKNGDLTVNNFTREGAPCDSANS